MSLSLWIIVYGEFVKQREPIEVGADLIAGSLIKNPGGGLAKLVAISLDVKI